MPRKAEAPDVRPGTKNEVIVRMIQRKNGATYSELCKKIGWKNCRATVGRLATRLGLNLERTETANGDVRFKATGGDEPIVH